MNVMQRAAAIGRLLEMAERLPDGFIADAKLRVLRHNENGRADK